MPVALQNNQLHLKVSEVDLALVEATMAAIGPEGARVAIRSALNDTARYGRTQLVRLMAKYLNLPAAVIRDRVSVKQQATKENLEAVISIDYHAVPLIKFRARWSKRRGVTVRQIKGEASQKFVHQFKATMASGHVGTFERKKGAPMIVPQSGKYAGRVIKRGPRKGQPVKRQQITETFGVSVMRAFELNPDLQYQALSALGDKLQERISSKLDWQLAKAKAQVPESV